MNTQMQCIGIGDAALTDSMYIEMSRSAYYCIGQTKKKNFTNYHLICIDL